MPRGQGLSGIPLCVCYASDQQIHSPRRLTPNAWCATRGAPMPALGLSASTR
jgi:hypothetical protein